MWPVTALKRLKVTFLTCSNQFCTFSMLSSSAFPVIVVVSLTGVSDESYWTGPRKASSCYQSEEDKRSCCRDNLTDDFSPALKLIILFAVCFLNSMFGFFAAIYRKEIAASLQNQVSWLFVYLSIICSTHYMAKFDLFELLELSTAMMPHKC